MWLRAVQLPNWLVLPENERFGLLIFQIPRGVNVLPILCVTSACLEYKGNNLLSYLILGYGLRKCWVDWFL